MKTTIREKTTDEKSLLPLLYTDGNIIALITTIKEGTEKGKNMLSGIVLTNANPDVDSRKVGLQYFFNSKDFCLFTKELVLSNAL